MPCSTVWQSQSDARGYTVSTFNSELSKKNSMRSFGQQQKHSGRLALTVMSVFVLCVEQRHAEPQWNINGGTLIHFGCRPCI